MRFLFWHYYPRRCPQGDGREKCQWIELDVPEGMLPRRWCVRCSAHEAQVRPGVWTEDLGVMP